MRPLSVDKLNIAISRLHSGKTTCQISSSTGFCIVPSQKFILNISLTSPSPDVNVSQVEAAICFFTDGGGNSLRVVEPTLKDGENISGCTIANREAILFRIVELMFHLHIFEHNIHIMHKLLLRSHFWTFKGVLEPLIYYGTDVIPLGQWWQLFSQRA